MFTPKIHAVCVSNGNPHIKNREVRTTDGDQLIGQKSDSLKMNVSVLNFENQATKYSPTASLHDIQTLLKMYKQSKSKTQASVLSCIFEVLWKSFLTATLQTIVLIQCQSQNNLLKLCNYVIAFLNYLPFKQLNFTQLIY